MKPAWKNRISMTVRPEWKLEWGCEIPGNPIAKKRPRVYRNKSGKSHGVNVQKDAEQAFAWRVKSNQPPYYESEPLELEVIFIMPIPKSFSKAKRERAMFDELLPIGKPDVDNLLKFVLDSCNGILYKDDAQVVDLIGRMRYGDEPKTVIKIRL